MIDLDNYYDDASIVKKLVQSKSIINYCDSREELNYIELLYSSSILTDDEFITLRDYLDVAVMDIIQDLVENDNSFYSFRTRKINNLSIELKDGFIQVCAEYLNN